MTVLIPAYKPNERLIQLIHDLNEQCEHDIVIVDDGSGPDYKHIFDAVSELGCTVLTHEINKGKGAALKTGFLYIQQTDENTGVVTADCDGQHPAKDIVKVAAAINKDNNAIVIGTRRFSEKVPLRSRLGNSITRTVFAFVTGARVYDTQTGLRGFPIQMLPWLCEISGDRYEFEMNMLMEAVQVGYSFIEVDIETVYIEQNKSSHFNPLKDSLRVYMPIIKFSMSSLVSAALDFVLLITLQLSTKNLFISVVGARICSALFNYIINKHYVFISGKKASITTSFTKYSILAIVVMMANYCIIDLYYSIIGLPLVLAKILTEATIFLFSYWAQRKFVFVSKHTLNR